MAFPDELIEIAEKQKRGRSVQARVEGSAIFDTPSAISSLLINIAGYADNVPAWSYYPTMRDTYLRQFYKTEPKLAGAVYSMSSFGKSLDLQLDGLPRAKKYSQTMLNDCENGRGYRQLVEKSLIDLFTTDNGCFWELIGTGSPERPLRGQLVPPYIMHMDSLRCWRTFDEEYPVLYQNPLDGTYHKMHYTRVLSRASMEQPDELARGIGFSPTSRVLRETQYMRDILIYRHEKVSGSFTRALIYGHGINAQTLKDNLEASKEQAQSEGFALYKGIPIITRAAGEMALQMLDLASVPDGFNLETETTLYMYILSLAFGVDAREFWPATASGATKADATIQDMKAQGKGKGDVIETLESMWRDVFPETVEAEYDYTDDEQDLRKAQIWKLHTETFNAIKATGTIDAEEARAHLVKEGVLDAALLKATTPEQANAEPVTDTTPVEDEATETPSSGGTPELDSEKPTEESEPLSEKTLKKKDLNTTRAQFEAAFSNILAGALARDYTRAQFEAQLYRLIRRYGESAYRDGLTDGGVDMEGEPLDREDMAAFNQLLSAQVGYIGDLGAVLYNEDLSDDQAASKPDMWFNKSVVPFYQRGLLSADANGLYEWILGATEKHCGSCATMAGQVHRLREYEARGIKPQSSALECAGYHCKCSLQKTRGRARGRWL